MSNHAKCFETRKASAEETARWMVPTCDKARESGSPTVTVPLKDLVEVLSYVEAVHYRNKVEFGGKHLGYCEPDAMRAMLSREKTSISCISKKTDRFCVAVSFLELPPKPLPKPEELGIIESAEAVER